MHAWNRFALNGNNLSCGQKNHFKRSEIRAFQAYVVQAHNGRSLLLRTHALRGAVMLRLHRVKLFEGCRITQ